MASLFGQALIEACHRRLPIRFENLGFLRRIEILGATPAINTVLDVTDHAGGTNPYYQPGKNGVSPL